MRNGTAAQPAQTASTQRQRLHVSDFPELNLEGKTDGLKRSFTLRQKADLISQYDALPVGSEERGELLKKYQIYWNMINRWRADCKREGISIPNLKLKLERTMNGHADVFEGLLHHGPHKGGPRPGAGRPRGSHAKPKENTPGQFQSAQDVVDWLTIQIEERQKIREELEQHVGKTRNE